VAGKSFNSNLDVNTNLQESPIGSGD